MEKSQELVGFWAQKGLTSVIELVKTDYESEALERMERNCMKYSRIGSCCTSLAAAATLDDAIVHKTKAISLLN